MHLTLQILIGFAMVLTCIMAFFLAPASIAAIDIEHETGVKPTFTFKDMFTHPAIWRGRAIMIGAVGVMVIIGFVYIYLYAIVGLGHLAMWGGTFLRDHYHLQQGSDAYSNAIMGLMFILIAMYVAPIFGFLFWSHRHNRG